VFRTTQELLAIIHADLPSLDHALELTGHRHVPRPSWNSPANKGGGSQEAPKSEKAGLVIINQKMAATALNAGKPKANHSLNKQ